MTEIPRHLESVAHAGMVQNDLPGLAGKGTMGDCAKADEEALREGGPLVDFLQCCKSGPRIA